LTTIPPEILSLQLEELDVSNNVLTTIPDSIADMSNLQKLTVSGNKLTTVPHSIGKLSKLTLLDIKSNEIAELPIEMGKLLELKKIDCSHNMLTELPWEMGSLQQNLSVLEIGHNPLVIPPRPVIAKGTLEILKWLKSNEKEGQKAKVSGLGLQKDGEPPKK